MKVSALCFGPSFLTGSGPLLLLQRLSLVPSRPRPPVENVWWSDFLIWNVRWAIKSQSAQLAVVTSSTCKMAALIFVQSLQILENSVDQRSVFFKDWATTNLLKNKLSGLRVCVREGCRWQLKLKFDDWNEEVYHSFHLWLIFWW